MPLMSSRIRGGGQWGGAMHDTAALAATAAGANQAAATPITTDLTVFTTVALNTGAILPTATQAGEDCFVVNAGANALSLYPPVGHKANAAATNAAVSVAVGKSAHAVFAGSGQWVVVVSA
jgi:hypothetical protein